MSGLVILKFLAKLMLPPASMALGFFVSTLLALAGLRRLGLSVAVLTAFETLLLSFPPVSDALVAPLQQYAREEAAKGLPCCYAAIVILGADSNNLRVLHGVHLYKTGIANRIIVSGGNPASVPGASKPEAEDMKELLVLAGVPTDAITTEDVARNTAENIANVKQIAGDEPVALVTSAYHMKRALQLARRIGLRAYAFPADFVSSADQRSVWDNWLPTLQALRVSAWSLWEYLGIAFDYRSIKPTDAL